MMMIINNISFKHKKYIHNVVKKNDTKSNNKSSLRFLFPYTYICNNNNDIIESKSPFYFSFFFRHKLHTLKQKKNENKKKYLIN